MSRTIITNSGSDFLTNINSEILIGVLCEMVGAKLYMFKQGRFKDVKMSYSMTEEETLDTCKKLEALYPKLDEIFPELINFFEPGCNSNDLKEFLDYIIECFKNSKGYECLG